MAKDFNSQQVVDSYDLHIRKLIPGYEIVHQQILAIMKAHLSARANVLIIGAGTGYELGYLLQAFPECRFTVTELSEPMLNKARSYAAPWNNPPRVEFVLGQHNALSEQGNFDAVLSILVTHFVPPAQKLDFLQGAQQCLKPDGIFLTFDLMQFHDWQEASALKQLCEMNGLAEKQTQAMLERMAEDFFPLNESTTRNVLQAAGFRKIECFTQILCYQGFIATK
ncbi:class I SAM-dependent methyltransferase [Acinetobacter pragensis]|uniref:SAM-dependent methyltransferase n=1 Tax=Acinetobacter pragensis TaxID=1806892 RepID=A0A151XZS8_9GAMM|nr:class I SAM-dependent methyltransferase [Acinetobacter pragensis]KYQ71318.1 SAM-dependent methyltransferase [Acinetobacter pragensis]